MATAAPIISTPASAPFTINGTIPFQYEGAGDYVRAAHAIACLGAANTCDAGANLYSNGEMIAAGFDAIALLLAHAERIVESGAQS